MKQEIEQVIGAAARQLFDVEAAAELSRPDEQFGDYATNIALRLSKQVGQNPREIAEALSVKIREMLADKVSDVSVAGPGFINVKLSDASLIESLKNGPVQSLQGKQIIVEFGDPNPFKEMHIGHLYSYIVGDAICNVLAAAGADVKRLSYHGDVGLHVAKAIWGLQQEGVDPAVLSNPQYGKLGYYYALGAQAYNQDAQAKQAIDALNVQIYAQDPALKDLYEQGRASSFANFDTTLKRIGVKNDRRYLESESAPAGLVLVKQNIGKVFTESDGAVVYEGEKVGLHTRVFITGKGLPTYEAKDLGLTELKNHDYPEAAGSIIITANEQAGYFKVMLAALAEINPELARKTTHRTHGFISLSTGKMSSRTGDVFAAVDLLDKVQEAVSNDHIGAEPGNQTYLAAIKYAFAKHRLGGDIVYDVEESIALEGNSGPYLQYAHARAKSILAKVDAADTELTDLETDERSLARKLSEYAETVDKAVDELMPHHICTYLYELAQTFNRFYEKNRVIGDERQAVRLTLVGAYAETLKRGLALLGIHAPDRM